MAFRNNTEAENLRLRNELREAQEKLAEIEAKNKAEKEIKESLPKPPGWFTTKLTEYHNANAKAKKIEDKWNLDLDLDKREPFSRSAMKRRKRSKVELFASKLRRFGPRHDIFGVGIAGFMVLIGVAILAAMVYSTYRYCTDITEGTVIGHEFVEEYESCHRDDNGFEHCSDYGPYYILTIQEGTETADWHVSEGDYSFYHNGDRYCYEDWFRGRCN